MLFLVLVSFISKALLSVIYVFKRNFYTSAPHHTPIDNEKIQRLRMLLNVDGDGEEKSMSSRSNFLLTSPKKKIKMIKLTKWWWWWQRTKKTNPLFHCLCTGLSWKKIHINKFFNACTESFVICATFSPTNNEVHTSPIEEEKKKTMQIYYQTPPWNCCCFDWWVLHRL